MFPALPLFLPKGADIGLHAGPNSGVAKPAFPSWGTWWPPEAAQVSYEKHRGALGIWLRLEVSLSPLCLLRQVAAVRSTLADTRDTRDRSLPVR